MKRNLFNQEHHLLRQSVREFIQQEIVPHYEEWENQGFVPKEIWQKVGSLGWLCPTAEESFGGLAADLLTSVVIGEELSYHGFPSFFISLHNDIVFHYLQNFGNDEQKRRWIPGCISGENILAIAMTEPHAGSDLANIKTTAIKDGDSYIVNGSKTFISNGQLADLVVVVVRTNPLATPAHRGISLLVVEGGTAGFQRGKNLQKIGLLAQDTSELFFENCRVPVKNLLGEEGQGFKYLMQNLQQERLILAVGGVAHAQGALEETRKYVQTREAFGQAIGKFQHTRFTLADMFTQVQVAQTFVDELLLRHMKGEHLVKEASMAKLWVTEMEFSIIDRCLQLFGGYGYMREYPISRYFLDARVQRIYGGTNEIMKEIIARELLGP